MDELYSVGERVALEQTGAAGGFGGFAGGDNDAALADLLAGGGDIEQYLQSYEQMLSEGFSQQPQLNQVDAEGGITVRPEPGFVVKTRDTTSGMKVFINVVANEHVEKPHMKSFAELEGEEGCRVPLSVGTPVEDFDKKNEPCVTYDVVANPEVVDECQKTPAFRESLVPIVIASVAQKYKVELDQRFKLPKLKYKGDVVQCQRMRKKGESQIKEVSTAAAPGAHGQGKHDDAVPGGLPRPDFCIYYLKPGASFVDGFTQEWGFPPENISQGTSRECLNGFDLPCYRVNQFNEKIRGTMRNETDRTKMVEEIAEKPGEKETCEVLAGRTCVVQVRMPGLDRHHPALRQFGVEVSDECLRVSFPLLPRASSAAYTPLQVWWPRLFCAAQANAGWNPKTDILTVSLPTEAPAEALAFDQELLEAVF